jgi:sarcosine oxidase subunit beta
MTISIVGAGITGLSVAYHLAERGADVVVHERTGIGAEASGVQPGGVRQQWSTRINCELARESVVFYRDVAERLDARTSPRLDACGYAFLAHSEERLAALAADVALQNAAGVPSKLVGPDRAAELIPGLDASQVLGAAYCAEDGYFDQPQAVVEAFGEACRRAGVTLDVSAVAALAPDGAGWSLATQDGRTVHADAVVVAAGYDTPQLVAGLGIEVPIAKEARYLLLSDPIRERLLEPLVVSSERRLAAKHLANGRVLASDLAATGDPEANAPVWRSNVRRAATELLPMLEYVTYPVVAEGFYDTTPDHQPVLGSIPGHDGLWIAAGFSGHGFMLAPAVGRILADAVVADARDSALDVFAIDRFDRGNVVPELQIV